MLDYQIRDRHAIEEYMRTHMNDAAHDPQHVYRVLNSAVDIARSESGVDMEVLVAACLLHDIGRDRQYADPSLCHAQEGGGMAYDFLISLGWERERAEHVRACIASHRFRKGSKPESIEAKILFDADKLDAAGAIGIVRTLIHSGDVDSFIHEYNFKLKRVYDKFYTARGREIAEKRKKTAVKFYEGLMEEIV